MRRLRWEAEAVRQYQDALSYIASHDIAAAGRLAEEVADRLEMAVQFPAIGRIGRVDGTRELVVHPNYLVVYAIREGSIDIVRFLHSRQLYP